MSESIAVAICTYNRPRLLGSLLETVEAIRRADLGDGGIHVVVVDDSPTGSARTVVEAAGPPGTVHYRATAAGDISLARNTAVATAAALAPFVVCIDDDCLPQPGWLSELMRVANETDAAIIVGHRRFVPSEESPRWLRHEPFLQENELYPDGAVPVIGNMANVLIRSAWLVDSGIRFRTDLGRLGGEDMVFFADARAAGAEIRFAARSVVLERCDANRSTYRYQLWRQLWLGNNEAQINARTGDLGRARLCLRGLRRALRGVVWPIRCLLQRRRPQLRWSLALVASGAGMVAGAAGVRFTHRSE